ncbi:SET domain-containing protein [Coccomyxa subellipsoidea C-169]|uniref:SET domain-containing protein n=1 Tax=Coccomyxa subellipsoidea (strain C-169) TaxID=574566 RepID=I0YI08_COCSC|nr:SET domain-containing protein [Coccomyxa subellipsoidea C-169]EIE18027.1 SET domain-containing protein [Coccomyxa subellipsoidea C-169]|eukprot:XP_005642571.1 SET domain-containing protein [Coccomyxa subellipsoidea C-169]
MKLHKQLSWTSRFSLALVASIALIILYCKIGTTSKDTQLQRSAGSSSQHRLLQWVKANGGTAGVGIGTVNDKGLRGVFATRSFKEGDTIISIPDRLAVGLASHDYTAAELTFALLRLQSLNSEWWDFMKPYWDSLPKDGEVLREQSFSDDLLALLQDKALAAEARKEREFAEALYHGTAERGYEQGSLAQEMPNLNISLQEFKHLSTVIGSYTFAFSRKAGEDVMIRYMLPLMDKMNHAAPEEATALVRRDHSAGQFLVIAIRDIREGDEVRFTYNLSLLRNDASLFKYGFVQQQDPPRLCGVDLPGGYLGGVQEGPPWEYYAGGRLATRAEHARLTKLLSSFPTSEEEDSRILKSQKELDRWARTFIEFRMLRKRALQHTIKILNDTLSEL